jgi:hypothetical protein
LFVTLYPLDEIAEGEFDTLNPLLTVEAIVAFLTMIIAGSVMTLVVPDKVPEKIFPKDDAAKAVSP